MQTWPAFGSQSPSRGSITMRRICSVPWQGLEMTRSLFVRVIKSADYLVHQTAREFLMNSENPESESVEAPWKGFLRLVESNIILAERYIWYLLLVSFETELLEHTLVRDNVDPSEGPCPGYIIRQYLSKYDFLSYSALSWATHFREADIRAHSATSQLSCDLCNTRMKRFQLWLQIYKLLSTETTRCSMHNTDLQVRCHFEHERAESFRKAIIPLHIATKIGSAAVVNLLLRSRLGTLGTQRIAPRCITPAVGGSLKPRSVCS
ncbi:hypothetical protein P168DRAFT_39494 [Aspergillus campestris IBT 28561]|uniref:Uncharacterized protein n=1 Tax=Aspergillus campestris (strain IBT 28561) TaxID=1392248 RepID=A0A2I1CWI7_ASPC2|nr:uncharacterized protein P168DRAFT_39494 [Aspergillus campestris IBT 28561]PKY01984.1 hypothetical protein P168DRAFT_39494 [Aspergillus campestris IBT 28561]